MCYKYVKILILVLITLYVFTIPACSSNNAQGIFETAEFEELQNNREHAMQLYEEIIKKYPEGEYAAKAEARLDELRKQ